MHRADYLARIRGYLTEILGEFIEDSDSLEILYRRGWSADKAYSNVLEESLPADREQGFTRCGPQRADFILKYRGKPVSEALSRGQQKILVIGLKLAQAFLLKELTGQQSLFLLDDLGAELDLRNQEKVMEKLSALDAQVFATAIEFPNAVISSSAGKRMFHVEHGMITKVV